MKSFIIKIICILLLTGAGSCSKDALRSYDTLQQLNAVESVNNAFLLSSVIKKTALFYQAQTYDNTRLPGAVQYIVRNFQGGDNYYGGFTQPADDLYKAMEILKLVDGAIVQAEKRETNSYKGIFIIFRAQLFSYMTDFYGDIYYSQALKGREGILYPKYDKQQDIYTGILAELDQANTLIAQGTESISPNEDLFYAGDKTKWRKYANSLKLRLLMRASAKLPDAGSRMQAIVSDAGQFPIFTENEDNAALSFIGTTDENSWTGGKLHWANKEEFDKRRPSKTLIDKLTDLNDPRMPIWFEPVSKPWTSNSALDGVTVTTTDPNGYEYTSTWEKIDRTNPNIAAQNENILDSNKLYAGFIAGMNGDFKNGNGHYDTEAGGVVGNFKVSKFSGLFRENNHPLLKAVIMNSDELQFILAEAVVKGLIGGDANAYYRKGITLSLQRWGVSDAEINTYLGQGSIALPGDNTGNLKQIADQKWIALFLVSVEAYLDIRRTQLPDIFEKGRLSSYRFPQRFRYPGEELGQNKEAYDAGVNTLSPSVDNEFSKMWLLQ